MLRHHNSPVLSESSSPFTHVVLDGSHAFLSGLVAADMPEGAAAKGDIRAETEIVMRTIRSILLELGLGMERIVRVDVHLLDLDEMAEMDEIYRSFFASDCYPARTCTQSDKLFGDCRVEITCVAKL